MQDLSINYRGAGDTEFKNRVLPHIKTKMVNRVLGLFLGLILELSHDNRHEQHANLWKTELKKG